MNRGLPAAAVALALSLTVLSEAHAAENAVTCSFEYSPELSPGLSLKPGAGKVSSDPETGMATCKGTLNGAAITGPGPFGFVGTYGTEKPASCQDGGTGTGFVMATIPTDKGDVTIKDPIRFGFGPGSGFPPAMGDWTGERTTGVYLVVPTEGDCVTSPVTTARGTGRFQITG
jgi:hypothetical protein